MPVVDAMIQTFTEQVLIALQKQVQFAYDFRNQFEQMRRLLDLMKAYVTNLESLKHTNQVAMVSLNEIREVIYEADNILTDCIVRDEYKKHGSCFGLSLGDPIFLHQTGKKLKDINLRMEQLESTLRGFQTTGNSIQTENTFQVGKFKSHDCSPCEIIGLEDDLKEIKGWIFDTNEILLRIAIVGMGGLGKTTLAQKIYHDSDVLKQFGHLAWVCVSRDFNKEKVIRSMLERLGLNASGLDSSQLLRKLQEVLADKTCLIVMDDVWHMDTEWWADLCSILRERGGKRSCIIITTRNEAVATEMVGHTSRIHWPKTLDDREGWTLFSKFAFSSSNGICQNPQLENLGKKIMKKCGGLPLAIKTIGALLESKIESPVVWIQISDSFHELTKGGGNDTVMASLKLSYEELLSLLKQCLLCFSIYPEDFEIRTEQLIHWWIAEGLVQGKDSKSAVEVGYEYLLELIKRCLVETLQQRHHDGKLYKCKIHDMVRELIISKAEEESFCSFDGKGKQTLTTKPTRWVSITDALHGEPLTNNSKIRALLVILSGERLDFGNYGLLRSLRVLDFSYSSLKEINIKDLFEWISALKRLANLNLSGVQDMDVVPSSIRKLRNLQLLILTGCSNLKMIHPSITRLKKLIVLNLECCPLDINLPKGLGRLSYLEELSGFMVANPLKRRCCQLLELRELKNLRVLRISLNDDTKISGNEQNILADLKNLKVLDIDFKNCEEKNKKILEMVDGLTPPPILQELYLKNYSRETLPRWVSPSNLQRLKFFSIENADLINLTAENEDSSRWNIEGLCLKYLRQLEVEWKDLEKVMPVLRYMEVSNCYNLKDFPPVDSKGVWRKPRLQN